MKTSIKLLLFSALILSSTACSDKEKTELENQKALTEATREELESAVADRDELLSLVGEISQGLNEIKSLQNIISVDGGEVPNQKQQLQNDIAAIQSALIERQNRLEELQKKLSKSNLYTKELSQTIENLKQQLRAQEEEIQSLKLELEQANQTISRLGNKVDSLNTEVADVSSQRDQKEQENIQLQNEMNKCYYVAANKKELKSHNILESGFLKKTKIMSSDFDKSFFTTADRRNLSEIKLHSKKAKVLTNQPASSYSIVDEDGQKVLKISDKDQFWSLGNYLVIQID